MLFAVFEFAGRSAQILANSNEVTLKSSYCCKFATSGLNSGFGCILTQNPMSSLNVALLYVIILL